MVWLKKVVGGGIGYAVAGPVGALVGIAAAGGGGDDKWHDLSDVPTGVHVEATHQDDIAGRLYLLTFLSDIPGAAVANLRLLNDAAQSLSGQGAFADSAGDFSASARIHKRSCSVYVPNGAAEYTSPKHISLEVTVWNTGMASPTPVGKGFLDATLAAPTPWQPAVYLAPLLSLCTYVLTAGNTPALREMAARIASDFELDASLVDQLMARTLAPLDLQQAVRMMHFRFPGVDADGYRELLESACFTEEEPMTSAQETRLEDALGRLATSD